MARKPKRPTKPQRRKRGSGSISYDSKRAQWRAICRLPDQSTRSQYFAEQSQAEAWLNAQGTPSPPKPQTLEAALADFLQSREYLKQTTLTNYTVYSARIALILGELPISAVTPADVGRMDKEHRSFLAAATADQILTLLSTLYEWLMALETPGITRNPVTSYRKATPARARAGRKAREARALDYGMCRLLLAALDGDPYREHILWLLLTGMRVGELRGLRWANVSDSEIRIVEQRRSSDRHSPAPLKTEEEIGDGRVIPTPPGLLLRTVRSEGLVFPNRDGGSFDETTLRTHLNAALTRARLPHIRIHDLRHTANSGWSDCGASERMCAALLGHTPKSQTGKYTHPSLAAMRPFVAAWAELLLGESSGTLAKLG